jgi:hypothetical protein
MKTISNNNRNFPKPFRFAIYVVAVTIVGFMNWMAISANDPVMESSLKLESRLSEALAPLPDPEPELEEWILKFADDFKKNKQTKNSLETRLAEALEPAEDPEYELEDWILTLSEDILSAEMD